MNTTIIQIGSTTKVFNAMIVMSLVDENHLDLDTPVKRYVPNLVLADPTATEIITLRQLLSMSSGLDNGAYTDSGTEENPLTQYITSLKTMPQAFTPGSAFGYPLCHAVEHNGSQNSR